MDVWIDGVGVIGPGLAGWASSSPVLRGEARYVEAELALAAPALASARERRRASPSVRLALNAAEDALSQSAIGAKDLAAVFGSANSDGMTLHHLLESLADPNGMVSPTQFHNSVHNAAIGYWSIGTGSHLAGSSLAAHDYTFAAAMLKSAVHVRSERLPVIMVAFDMPFPEPLHSVRPHTDGFGVSLILTPAPTPNSVARMAVSWSAAGPDRAISEPRTDALRRLWLGNPAGRAVPLLEAVARGEDAEIALRYPDDGILLSKVTKC